MTAAAQPPSPPTTPSKSGPKTCPYCPGPKAPLWSMHPRVFLDVTHTGQASCPYCGAAYRLKPGTVVHGH